MPNYLFRCKQCKIVFEELTDYDATKKYPGVVCPECGSKKKDQMPTACNFVFTQPEGTSRWISESLGQDYKYKTKIPGLVEQREQAEKKSHMGSSKEIYKDLGDINVDRNYDFKKI